MTQRIKSLEDTSRAIRSLTDAHIACVKEAIDSSDLHDAGKSGATQSANCDDSLVDILYEFDQLITELTIEDRE